MVDSSFPLSIKITGRFRPPASLSRLFVHGDAIELRSGDLAMSSAEIVSFAEALKSKTDTLITFYGSCYGLVDRYNPDILSDALYDRTKLKHH